MRKLPRVLRLRSQRLRSLRRVSLSAVFFLILALAPTGARAEQELRLKMRGQSSGRIVVNTLVKSANGAVHSISFFSNSANSEVAIYDSNSTTSGNGTLLWEGRTATANNSYTHIFNAPLLAADGIRVEPTNGAVVFLEYE